MKTKEELNALKEEVETANNKFNELTDEELAQVSGGANDGCDSCIYYGSIKDCKAAKLLGKCKHGITRVI